MSLTLTNTIIIHNVSRQIAVFNVKKDSSVIFEDFGAISLRPNAFAEVEISRVNLGQLVSLKRRNIITTRESVRTSEVEPSEMSISVIAVSQDDFIGPTNDLIASPWVSDSDSAKYLDDGFIGVTDKFSPQIDIIGWDVDLSDNKVWDGSFETSFSGVGLGRSVAINFWSNVLDSVDTKGYTLHYSPFSDQIQILRNPNLDEIGSSFELTGDPIRYRIEDAGSAVRIRIWNDGVLKFDEFDSAADRGVPDSFMTIEFKASTNTTTKIKGTLTVKPNRF